MIDVDRATGTVSFGSPVVVGSNATINGAATVSGTMDVSGFAAFHAGASVAGPQASDDSANVPNTNWVRILLNAAVGALNTAIAAAQSAGIAAGNAAAAASLPLIGGTLTGALNVAGGAGSNRLLQFLTGAKARWAILADGAAENGGNAGSNLEVLRFADDGSILDSPMQITRASGAVYAGLLTAGTLNVNGQGTINSPASAADQGNAIANTDFVQRAAAAHVNRPAVDALYGKSAAANGYVVLPNGFVLQWGSATTNQYGGASFGFAQAFANSCLQVTASVQNADKPYSLIATLGATSASGATVWVANGGANAPASGITVGWMAIGY